MSQHKERSPWAWVPSLYFAEGLPYVMVMTVSVIMYKRLGISNTDIAIYTSWLYLPWVIKPLWSPIVDLLKTKRWWIVVMQLIIGAGMASVAFTIPASDFFRYTLAAFWLIAFSSATHDIAADGFYMLGLNESKQAYFIGIRSTFYRIAMLTGQGLLIIVAGFFESFTGLEPVRFTVESTTSQQVYSQPEIPISNKQSFVLTEYHVTIPTDHIDKQKADSIKAVVTAHNIDCGFVLPENSQEDGKKAGWWSAHVSKPLAGWLKTKIGRQDTLQAPDHRGNMRTVGIHLRQAPEPGKEIILNINQRGGDKSIRLISGERLVFNDKNWDKHAILLLELDPKLDKPAETLFEGRSGNIPKAWTITFFIVAGLFLCFTIYHRFFLPHPEPDQHTAANTNFLKEFLMTFASFFTKAGIIPALAFILLFRLGEAQLLKMASPFLLDDRTIGGLGLTTGDVGLVYGTVGLVALTVGGIVGGILVSRYGLRYWIWWMTLAINIPTLVYVYMAVVQPSSLWVISTCVAFEQFGYGFGFTAYMMYLIYFCEGKHKTAHYALCTGFMALGMMFPGMVSGWIQDVIGYKDFFIWVVLCGIPAMLTLKFLKIDPTFGFKSEKNAK